MSDYLEDRIAKLEHTVQKLHVLAGGHKWYRGRAYTGKLGGGSAECACGASEYMLPEEYDKLPSKYALEVEW